MVTLIGAYHPDRDPLDQRRLTVELRWDGLRLAATVVAEGLARAAKSALCVAPEVGGARVRFDFLDDAGAPCVLAVRYDYRSPTLRSLTQLSGAIGRASGVRIGPARLRINLRG